MEKYDISKIFNPDLSYTLISAVFQKWSNDSYSYLNDARKEEGIILIVEGVIDYEFGGKTIHAGSGDILYLPYNSRYRAVVYQEVGTTYDYLVNFKSSDMQKQISEPKVLLKGASKEYIDLFKKIVDGKINGRIFEVKSEFFAMLHKLTEDICFNYVSKNEQCIKKAAELLLDYEKPVSHIARECSISETGLRQLFRRVYRISPAAYRIESKINRAKYLLLSTDMTISEIADELKFYDEAYFCKVFKRHTLLSPKQYKKEKRM